MADYDLMDETGGGLLGGSGGGWLGNLLNFSGGRSTTADLYGDLFSKKQLAAIQQRESQAKFKGLLDVLAQAAAPSTFKKDYGQILGQAGAAMMGAEGGEKAATAALGGQLTAQKIAQLKQEADLKRRFLEEQGPLADLIAGVMGGTPGAPAPAPVPPAGSPTAPPPPPTPGAPVSNPAGIPGMPNTSLGGPPPTAQPPTAPTMGGYGIGGALAPPPGGSPLRNTGLPQGDPTQMFAGLLGGGAQRPPTEAGLPPPDTVIPSGPGGLLNPEAIQQAAMGFGGGAVVAPWARGNAAMGGKSSVEGLRSEFAGRLKTMIEAMPPELQARFKIESGFRDAARQQQVNPGVTNSRHTHGIAVDTNRDPDVQAWITANGPKFGVGYTLAGMKNEDNHLEMLGPDGGRVGGLPIMRAQYSPGGGGAPQGGALPSGGLNSDKLQTLMLELARRNASAEVLGMGTPYGSLLGVLQGSPAYKAAIETATRSAGVPFIGKETTERKSAEEPFEQRAKVLDLMIDMRKNGIIYNPQDGSMNSDPQYDAITGRREEDKQALIQKYQKELKDYEDKIAIGKEGRTDKPVTIYGPEGRMIDTNLPQAERDRRLREQSMRPNEFRPGDIVNKPTAPLSADMEYRVTPQGTFEPQPISNTPAARAAADVAKKDQLQQQYKQLASDTVVARADRIEHLMQNGMLPTTGLGGSLLARMGVGNANDIATMLTTIESNVAAQSINQMRQMSPTGAALGNTSDKDIEIFKTQIANVRQASSEAQFLFELREMKRQYLALVHGPEKAAELMSVKPPPPSDLAGKPSANKPYGPVRRID